MVRSPENGEVTLQFYMTTTSKSILRGAYIAILGLVFFLLPANKAVATVTYSWSSIASFDTVPAFSVARLASPQKFTAVNLDFNGTSFTGFSSLTDINFVDLRLKPGAGNNNNWYVVVCSSVLSVSGFEVCDSSTVIATSTSFTSNELVAAGAATTTWTRIYFDEPWSWTGGAGYHLYFTVVNDVSNDSMYFTQYGSSALVGYSSQYFYNTGSLNYYARYGAPIRIGYDDGVGVLLNTQNTIQKIDSTSFRFLAGFDIPKNITDLYDDFIMEWSFYLRAGVQVPVYYSAFDLDTDTAPGIVTFQADFDCSDEIYNFGSCFVATSAVTLSGILGASTTPLMVLNDIGISLGTSTTADNLNDYFGSLGLATNPELLPYARITIDTGLGYDPDSCKILYFDLVECFKYLVIPTADTGVKLYGVATTSIFSLPPFSWAYNFFDILGSDSTTSLPAVVLIVPNGIPGAGKSLDLSPWKAMRDFWLYVPSGNFITAATTSSIYEVTKPIFNVAYLLIFGFWFFLIVIKFKP